MYHCIQSVCLIDYGYSDHGYSAGWFPDSTIYIGGVIESSRIETITLPGGIGIASVLVKPGSRIAAGDPLLELDSESMEQAKTILRQEIAALDIQLNDMTSGSSMDSIAVDRANTALRETQEDYNRLLEQQELKKQRGQEDLTDAQTKQKQAETDLETAKEKAKQQLTIFSVRCGIRPESLCRCPAK